ncbi:unnamed protein product [Chironomus riparius]|uniref:Uncharacterized protein n=1 Tax=Chironomus riparius TaxID=315576 RepID=A0A9N9S6E7_9DIPT|nr:unnamed protein product [Chironomus riparius]
MSNTDSLRFSQSSKKIKMGPETPWIFGIVIFAYVICTVCKKKCCKKKQNVPAPDPEAINLHYYNQHEARHLPEAAMASETSSNLLPSTSFIPTAQPVEYIQLQAFQPTAPGIMEDDTPKYDSPPSYHEAMEQVNNNQKDHNSPIT